MVESDKYLKCIKSSWNIWVGELDLTNKRILLGQWDNFVVSTERFVFRITTKYYFEAIKILLIK